MGTTMNLVIVGVDNTLPGVGGSVIPISSATNVVGFRITQAIIIDPGPSPMVIGQDVTQFFNSPPGAVIQLTGARNLLLNGVEFTGQVIYQSGLINLGGATILLQITPPTS
jgi:hypothetical protein